MILTWNLNQQLDLTRETQQRQKKNHWFCHGSKLYDPWHVILSIFGIALTKGTIFTKKKNFDISKIKQLMVVKDIFCETTCACVLMYQFKPSNAILWIFRQEVTLPSPPHRKTNFYKAYSD